MRKAPWKDFVGADIYEGDVIQHPSGERGVVIFLPDNPSLDSQWRVNYGIREYAARLILQIGDKGQGIVTKRPSDQPSGDA